MICTKNVQGKAQTSQMMMISDNLKSQLNMNVSSLFLKMQAILHVSNMAVQEIVDHLNQISSLSQPLVKKAVSDTLHRNGHNIAEATLDEVVSAVMDSNILFSVTSKSAELSSSKRLKPSLSAIIHV